MHTAANQTTDNLRDAVADLNEVIFKIRRRRLEGKSSPRAAARYVAYVRECHQLREAGLTLGKTGRLYELMHPAPYRDQMVGFTAEQKKALEWKGVFSRFPAAVPHHFAIAAE